MFGIFKKKSPKEKLNKDYKKLLAEAHALSKTNRSANDAKQAEAQKVLEKIEALNS